MKKRPINPNLIQAALRNMAQEVAAQAAVMSERTGLSLPFCARMIAHQMAQPEPPRFTREMK